MRYGAARSIRATSRTSAASTATFSITAISSGKTTPDIQTYIDTRDGNINHFYPPSYTFEFDICYTDTVVVQPQYDTMLFNWFGSSDNWTYHCGYNFNDRMFRLVNGKNEAEVLGTYPYDLKKDTWYNWKFQLDNESCTVRLWVDDLSTEADNAESEWGQLIFNSCWRYFYCSSDEALREGVLLRYRMMNVQCMYDNIKVYNFASLKDVELPRESGGEITGGGTKTGGAGGAGTYGAATGDPMCVMIFTLCAAAVVSAAVGKRRKRTADIQNGQRQD